MIEITSKKTRLEDLNRKKSLYERLGVEEYFLFDPRAEYLDPPLQGFRLVSGRYGPVALEPDGSLVSRVLGLVFRREGERLRMSDARTRKILLRREEIEREAKEKVAGLEAEVARLRSELERLDIAG